MITKFRDFISISFIVLMALGTEADAQWPR